MLTFLEVLCNRLYDTVLVINTEMVIQSNETKIPCNKW